MADTTNSSPQPRELAFRANNGIGVSLLWHKADNSLTVLVSDDRRRESFELAVDVAEALEVFEHPYAYAAFRGIDYLASGETIYA